MSRIFISYRRADSIAITGRIHDYLVKAFGADQVFKDVDDIPLGSDFRAVLEGAVRSADVLLVIIGMEWTTVTSANGQRRLDDADDYVRVEVETALQSPTTLTVPVLVDGATLPPADMLPPSLRQLRYRNAAVVRHDPDFHHDMYRLTSQLRNQLGLPELSDQDSTDADSAGQLGHGGPIGSAQDERPPRRKSPDARHDREAGGPGPPPGQNHLRRAAMFPTAVLRSPGGLLAIAAGVLVLLLLARGQQPSEMGRSPAVDASAEATTTDMMALGRAARTARNFEEALVLFDAVLDAEPTNALAYYQRGSVYAEMGDYDRAVVDLTRAIRLDPNSANSYTNRGFAYSALDQDMLAVADFTEAIRLAPDDLLAHNNRGVAYLGLADWEHAIDDFSTAIRLDPQYAIAYSNRGIAYFRQGNLDQAIDDQAAAIRLNSEYAQAFLYRGRAYQAQGRMQEALADLSEAIRLAPTEADAYNYRASVYRALGEDERAEADVNRYRQLAAD